MAKVLESWIQIEIALITKVYMLGQNYLSKSFPSLSFNLVLLGIYYYF